MTFKLINWVNKQAEPIFIETAKMAYQYNQEHDYYYEIYPICTERPSRDVIDDVLSGLGISCEVWEDGIFTNVEIEWGDWKKDHGYCRWLMGELGFRELDSEITEEDGTDCYSAIHTYIYTTI